MILDSAVYADGRRLARAGGLRGLHADTERAGGFAWVGLLEPTAAEFAEVAVEFALHELAVEDAVKAHQRPNGAGSGAPGGSEPYPARPRGRCQNVNRTLKIVAGLSVVAHMTAAAAVLLPRR